MGILWGILLFSFLIFIHEMGHFVAAKLSGVQVNEFSLFMGPALFKKQWGETLYSIRLIPIGGYCAMEGEDGESDNPRAFSAASWWKRLIILCAGAFMNFVAGVLLLAICTAPFQQLAVPVVSRFEQGCTINGENGLQVGDEILEVDGENVYVASNFSMLLMLNPGDTHDLKVRRDGEVIEFKDFQMQKHEFLNERGEKEMRYGLDLSVVDATFGRKMSYVWNSAVDTVRTVRLSLQMLFRGQAGFKDMVGPVGIVQQISVVTEASPTALDAFYNLAYVGGFIAINLAVMNMLPIPALDGGRVFCLVLTSVIEAITRKKINPKYEAYIHGAGMVILLGLMALILFKDVFMIFKR